MEEECGNGLVLSLRPFIFLAFFRGNFKGLVKGKFKYLTKGMDLDKFLDKFDELVSLRNDDETAHGELVQKSLERTCAVELRKTFPSRDKRNAT